MKSLILAASLFAAACACGKKDDGTGPGAGTGTAARAGSCDEARAHVEDLYRGTESAADDVAMVMKDCAADPARVAGCAGAAKTAAELEQRCLIPLDDEGSEGDRFK